MEQVMLKFIGTCIKVVTFSLLVLILGNWIHWDGKTISDQIKLTMNHPETSHILGNVKSWATKLTQDARKGIGKKLQSPSKRIDDSTTKEEFSASEKQKLKALMRELNSSSADD